MSCECDDSSVVSQSSTFLSLLLPLSGGGRGRGGGQILRHDFCAFELTTMEGRGEEEVEGD